jgi:uncharacterized membrane-anchored protein
MTNGADPDPFHPQYRELHAELLVRPFPEVAGQMMVSHRAILFAPSEAAEHRAAVAALADFPEVVATPDEQGFQLLRLGEVELRIERHAEFTTFTVFAPQHGLPFAESAIDQLPEGFLSAIPGKILAAVEIACELVAALDAGTVKTMERVLDYFDQERLVGGWVVERVASVWTHFRPDERGATRFLIQIHRLTSGRYGRLLQRLVEIENCRMAAMLGLPVAREVLAEVGSLELRHVGLMERLGARNETDGSLPGDIAKFSLEVERLHARCGPRFSLTDSYARILAARVRELREEQVPGYQTLGEFFDQRLAEAWHTCERAEKRLTALSARLPSTTALLKVRTETVSPSGKEPAVVPTEPATPPFHLHVLAVVISTYCLAGLLKILLEAVSNRGRLFDPSLLTALMIPLLVYGVCRILRR